MTTLTRRQARSVPEPVPYYRRAGWAPHRTDRHRGVPGVAPECWVSFGCRCRLLTDTFGRMWTLVLRGKSLKARASGSVLEFDGQFVISRSPVQIRSTAPDSPQATEDSGFVCLRGGWRNDELR